MAEDARLGRERAVEVDALLAAGRALVRDLDVDVDLGVVLQRVVAQAVGLTHADHAALALVAEDGSLEEYVRFELAAGDRAEGARRRCVGVPVRARGDAVGNLCLGSSGAEPFPEAVRELLEVLADTAGTAVANARLLEESRRRQEWLAASTEVTRRVLAGDEAALRLVAQQVRVLADSDLTTVVLPVDADLLVAVAEGAEGAKLEGRRYAARGTLSDHVLQHGKAMRLVDAQDPANVEGTIYLTGEVSVGPVMVLPLLGREDVRGTLVVIRSPGRRPFTQADAEMATTFASHASLALELAEARRGQQRVLLLEDRARIARDLHDHVIQQVFAAGLVVQATASRLEDAAAISSLKEVVGNLDEAIKQIRVSIFQLQPPVPGSLRAAVLDVVAEVMPGLGFDPRLDLDGPLDSVATADLVRDVTAVVREALVNVARHAQASAVVLSIHATTSRLTVTVSDDGVGVGGAGRRSGLGNMRQRAEGRHGSMVLAEVPDLGGTTLVWTVPIT